MHEVLQGTSTGIHKSVNSSTSSAHSTHIKSLTTTTHSSPHLCTYLQVRFPPLYAEVDALLGCWSMVTVCQERPWTPAVHTDRNVQRGARARNERGVTITKHLQHPTCMTRRLRSPSPRPAPSCAGSPPERQGPNGGMKGEKKRRQGGRESGAKCLSMPAAPPGARTRTTAGRGLPHTHPTPQPDANF